MSVASDFSKAYRVDNGKKFRLKDFDPDDTSGVKSRKQAEKVLPLGIERMVDLQDKLYAQDRWAILLIFQAMDAAGKDGVIKHVMSGVNPQGCQVYSFKQPSAEELQSRLPVAHQQVHPGARANRHLQPLLLRGGARGPRAQGTARARKACRRRWSRKNIWNERFADINAYEQYLSRNGVVIRKFFLNLSKDEQKTALPEAARRA